MLTIPVILGSTRPNRQGEKPARWAFEGAKKQIDWMSELIDLRDWPFPFFDLPYSPAAGKDKPRPELIERWSEKIAGADGFVIVTPEYNHGYPAVLKNALDFLYFEWNNKPVGFVGYSGGPVAGARAVEQLRQVVVELQMTPIRQDVLIPMVGQAFDDSGRIKDEKFDKKLGTMFVQLTWWAEALKHAREQGAQVNH